MVKINQRIEENIKIIAYAQRKGKQNLVEEILREYINNYLKNNPAMQKIICEA